MSAIQATVSTAEMNFNRGERHYAKSMANEIGVSIKALAKDALEIDNNRIDFAKRCTAKKMKKIVNCDLGSADIL